MIGVTLKVGLNLQFIRLPIFESQSKGCEYYLSRNLELVISGVLFNFQINLESPFFLGTYDILLVFGKNYNIII